MSSRPVLVVSHSEAVPVLNWIVVAPITRSAHRIPTEVALGEAHGLAVECEASFDNLQPIRIAFLTERVGRLDVEDLTEICRARRALADC